MSDLTKFNLPEHQYSVAVKTERLDIDDWAHYVAVFNLKEQISFQLPVRFSAENAIKMADKVFDAQLIDLTLWDASDYHYAVTQDDINRGFVKVLSYDLPDEPIIDDEDGDKAYGAMLERQAQEFADLDNEFRYGR